MRRRLDAELVRRGLARSRQQAAELIAAGQVRCNGTVATKAATQVEEAGALVVVTSSSEPQYVSRGAHKLLGALAEFGSQGLAVADRDCLDVGASTGGFTDVLLRHGAARVIAVDVGHGLLAWSLRQDPRVTVLDRTHARDLTPQALPFRAALVVADVSFISLRLLLPALRVCAAPAADHVLMVKPQFELGRGRVGSGVVRDPELRAEAVLAVCTAAAEQRLGVAGVVASPLPGPKGNVEYFVWLRAGAPPLDPAMVTAAVAAGPV